MRKELEFTIEGGLISVDTVAPIYGNEDDFLPGLTIYGGKTHRAYMTIFTIVPHCEFKALVDVHGVFGPVYGDHKSVWCRTLADALEFLRLYGPIIGMVQ